MVEEACKWWRRRTDGGSRVQAAPPSGLQMGLALSWCRAMSPAINKSGAFCHSIFFVAHISFI